MAAPAPTVDALVTLRQGLDDTARALIDADLTRLLDSESQLQSALASLRQPLHCAPVPTPSRSPSSTASGSRCRRVAGWVWR